jgi:hypothetical protein
MIDLNSKTKRYLLFRLVVLYKHMHSEKNSPSLSSKKKTAITLDLMTLINGNTRRNMCMVSTLF